MCDEALENGLPPLVSDDCSSDITEDVWGEGKKNGGKERVGGREGERQGGTVIVGRSEGGKEGDREGGTCSTLQHVQRT